MKPFLSVYLSVLTFLFALPGLAWANADSLTLHYNRPAEFFEESLPLGNGQLGMLVYGGVADEHISLNDIALWTGEPDLKPWTVNASQYLPEVRRWLDAENYVKAEETNQMLEGHNSEIYQPLGTLLLTDLNARGETSAYRRSLCLNDALAEVRYTTDGGEVHRTLFCSAPDSVMVIRLQAVGPNASLRQRIGLACALPHTTQTAASAGALYTEGYAAYSTKPEQGKDEWFHYNANRGIHFRTELRVVAPEGCVRAESDTTLLIENCTEALLLLTDVTSFNGPYLDPVKQGRDYRAAVKTRLDAAEKKTFSQLMERHVTDYKTYFDRLEFDLGTSSAEQHAQPTDAQLLAYAEESAFNPDLEELYFQYGRYLLISSSRTSGIPANLQGLWNEHITPPWSCNYTVNINVEENYWPAETAALPEMHTAMLDWICQMPRSGAITAQNYYGILGEGLWCLNHNSDIWCMTNPVGYQKESPMWACWPLGGAWVSTHLWEHYDFTRDKDFLRETYPVMKGAVRFFQQWMVEKDGYLMTSPSTSPENRYLLPDGFAAATFYGGSADVAMIRELLTDTQLAARELGIDEAFSDTLQQMLSKLLPYRISQKGHLQEWYHDWDDIEPTHRHQSHLFGLYPGHQITVDGTPELAQACAQTLRVRGDQTTGWSAGWRVNLQAHLQDGEAAYHILRKLLSYVSPQNYEGPDKRWGGGTYPNFFDAHPPFQIDGNFGGTAGILEMLVQSRTATAQGEPDVVLLPALPKQWARQGHLRGVRLRGGYELEMEWRDGKVVSQKITPIQK